MLVKFITRDGEYMIGILMDKYVAYEGDMRYIYSITCKGRDYICVEKDGNLVEYVA